MPTRSRARTRRFCDCGPQRNGEHAAQAGEAGGVPFEKAAQDGFGVGAGAKAMTARFEFGAQFFVIVNFAVEDDDGIAVVRSRIGWSPEERSMIFKARGAERNQLAIRRRLAGPARDG